MSTGQSVDVDGKRDAGPIVLFDKDSKTTLFGIRGFRFPTQEEFLKWLHQQPADRRVNQGCTVARTGTCGCLLVEFLNDVVPSKVWMVGGTYYGVDDGKVEFDLERMPNWARREVAAFDRPETRVTGEGVTGCMVTIGAWRARRAAVLKTVRLRDEAP